MKNFYDTKILVGPGAYLVPGQKILPERTVCVQSRKIFFTPEQPLHPGLAPIYRCKFSGSLSTYLTLHAKKFPRRTIRVQSP